MQHRFVLWLAVSLCCGLRGFPPYFKDCVIKPIKLAEKKNDLSVSFEDILYMHNALNVFVHAAHNI